MATKETLGLYPHIAQLVTHTKHVYNAAAYLANYVTKPFDILQKVIKGQKVYISFGDSRS